MMVYVSWNGATEVATWNVFSTMADDSSEQLEASSAKTGFETMILVNATAEYVILEAMTEDRKVLRRSKPVRCIPLKEQGIMATASLFQSQEGFKAQDISEGNTGSFLASKVPIEDQSALLLMVAFVAFALGFFARIPARYLAALVSTKGPSKPRLRSGSELEHEQLVNRRGRHIS